MGNQTTKDPADWKQTPQAAAPDVAPCMPPVSNPADSFHECEEPTPDKTKAAEHEWPSGEGSDDDSCNDPEVSCCMLPVIRSSCNIQCCGSLTKHNRYCAIA